MSAENIVELTALTRKFWSFELILYFHLQNYIVDKNNISAECGNIPGCWKSLFQCHLATYNYGKGHFFSMAGHGKIYLVATSEFQTTTRTINSLETTSLACSVVLFLLIESLPGRFPLLFSTKVLFPEACAYVL